MASPNQSVLDRCPATVEALSNVPTAPIPGRSPNVFFSILRPHTRIPPHTGVTNTRAIVHLPLIVPDGCGFRVGGETRPWVEGQPFAFDDTIEHEAWNDSDELRAVLICDVWNPHLTVSEQQAIIRYYDVADFDRLQSASRQLITPVFPQPFVERHSEPGGKSVNVPVNRSSLKESVMRIISAALPLALIVAPLQAAGTNERTPPDRAPSTMTSTEIAAFNKGLELTHPYFIKCRKLEETGSLVKKARVCRTNEEWKLSSVKGNQNARDTVEAMSRAPINSN